jgi:hypothetical protein
MNYLEEATAPLLAEIAELKQANEAFAKRQAWWNERMFEMEQKLSAAPAAQPEPVAYLWQHSETGRTLVVMPDQLTIADANWTIVGPLYLGIKEQP